MGWGFRPVFVANSSRSLVEIKDSHDKMKVLHKICLGIMDSWIPQSIFLLSHNQYTLRHNLVCYQESLQKSRVWCGLHFSHSWVFQKYFLGCGIDRQTMEVVTETMSLYLGLLVRTMESRFHTQEGLPKWWKNCGGDMGNGFWAETTKTCTGRSGGMVKTNQRSMCQSGTHPWNAQPHLSWTCHIPSIATEVLKKHHGFSMGDSDWNHRKFPKSLEHLQKRRNTWRELFGGLPDFPHLTTTICQKTRWTTTWAHGFQRLSTLSTPLFWQTFPPGRVFFLHICGMSRSPRNYWVLESFISGDEIISIFLWYCIFIISHFCI